MAFLMCLIFLASVSLTKSNENYTVTADNVTFARQENGLPWPLVDFDNPGMLMLHGMHCYDVVTSDKETNEEEAEMRILHKQHCGSLIHDSLKYFEGNHTLVIDSGICDSIKEIGNHVGPDGKRVPRGFREYEYSCFGLSYRICRTKRSIPQTELSQTNAYVQLEAANLGALLKKKLKKMPMTNKELEYMGKMETPSARKLVAFGAYCQVNGDVEKLKKIAG